MTDLLSVWVGRMTLCVKVLLSVRGACCGFACSVLNVVLMLWTVVKMCVLLLLDYGLCGNFWKVGRSWQLTVGNWGGLVCTTVLLLAGFVLIGVLCKVS